MRKLHPLTQYLLAEMIKVNPFETSWRTLRLLCVAVGLGLSMLQPATSQQVVAEYSWEKLEQEGLLLTGEVSQSNGQSVLSIVNTNVTSLLFPLLILERPPISKPVYGIKGNLRYDHVQGMGYLEMWNVLTPNTPGRGQIRAFSRTLGNAGEPLAKITGTSEWRSFVLPFDRTGISAPPVKLELNIYLPAKLDQTCGVRLVGSGDPESWGVVVAAKGRLDRWNRRVNTRMPRGLVGMVRIKGHIQAICDRQSCGLDRFWGRIGHRHLGGPFSPPTVCRLVSFGPRSSSAALRDAAPVMAMPKAISSTRTQEDDVTRYSAQLRPLPKWQVSS